MSAEDRSIWNHADASGEIRERIASILVRNSIPGAAIAIVADGRSCSFAIGSRDQDPEHPTPLDPDAIFPIYSITKTFIATAILRLAEMDRISLDGAVHDLLPELSLDPAITIRHVLRHTSGLPDYGGIPDYHHDLRKSPGTPWAPAQFLERTRSSGMRFIPGKGWSYSNTGYLLLKRVLERITGMPFPTALDRLVIAPAGLRRTRVTESLADVTDLTPGFSTQLNIDPTDPFPRDISRRYHPGWVSHGLIASTAADVARFLDLLMRGQLLSAPMLAQMCEPVQAPVRHRFFAHPSYGLGLMIDPYPGNGSLLGHGGGGPGYSAAVLHGANADGQTLTVAALANRDREEVGLEIAWDIVRPWQIGDRK